MLKPAVREQEELMMAKLLTTEESADATYLAHPIHYAPSIADFKRRFHISTFSFVFKPKFPQAWL